jgi:UDP-N-acetyl-2-amino-2-deoxyglucuronate dehydrogenase
MTAQRRYRAGIIGLGMASPPHALSLLDLKDRVDVAAAFSPSAARRNAFAERFGFPVVDSADAIFKDRSIDYVLILTPPNTHLQLVQQAAETGKHVLIEKPLDITLERAEQLVETARKASIRLGVTLQRRFRQSFVETARRIAEGELGEIVSASMKLANWRPQTYYDEPGRGTLARDGGGVLMTQAIHMIDQLIALAGLPVKVNCLATTTPLHTIETEDLVHATLRFGNGAIGALSATTAAYPGFPDSLEILGTRGSAKLEGDCGIISLLDGQTIPLTDGIPDHGSGADPMAFSHHHHRALHANFLDALEADRSPRVSGNEALAAHRLIDALLRSSKDGRTVRLTA